MRKHSHSGCCSYSIELVESTLEGTNFSNEECAEAVPYLTIRTCCARRAQYEPLLAVARLATIKIGFTQMSGSQMQRRRGRPRTYKGLLREPMKFAPQRLEPGKSYEPGQGWPPHLEASWRAYVEKRRREDQRDRLRNFTELLDRITALQNHFGIDPSDPGSHLDLALMLSQKHERELIAAGRFSRVFQKYGLDPTESDQYFPLAVKIAKQHVPGFANSPEEKERRPGVIAMAGLWLADNIISEKLSEAGIGPKVAKVAQILQEPNRLKQYLAPVAAESIAEVIRDSGNDSRGKPSPLSDRALRQYISSMRSAGQAYFRGQPDGFQIQFVEKVVPLFIKKRNTD